MAQAVSRWHLTTEALIHFQEILRGICGGKLALAQISPRILRFPQPSIILPYFGAI